MARAGKRPWSHGARPRRRFGSRARGRRARRQRAGEGAHRAARLGEAARRVAALADPDGDRRLTAAPTVMRGGDAFNVVPAAGELVCDLRADGLEAFEPSGRGRPAGIDGGLEAELVRRWPGMDTRGAVGGRLLGPAAGLLGRPSQAGGAAAPATPATWPSTLAADLDGLGPRGGQRTTRTSSCRLASPAGRGRARHHRGGARASRVLRVNRERGRQKARR